MTGDLRPIFVASGRIWNRSTEELQELTIRFPITAGDDRLDEPTLHLKLSILPDGVGTFSREVHFMPPSGKWDWSYEIVDAYGTASTP